MFINNQILCDCFVVARFSQPYNNLCFSIEIVCTYIRVTFAPFEGKTELK